MNAIDKVAAAANATLVRELLKIDAKYGDVAADFTKRGVLKDDADMSEAEKADKKALREEIYQQLSRKAGGLAAKAAKLTAEKWGDLTGHEKKKHQTAKTAVKAQVDNRWARLRKFAATAAEEAAATAGETIAKAVKNQLERFTVYEVDAAKSNKKSGELPPELHAAWLKICREGLEDLIASTKL